MKTILLALLFASSFSANCVAGTTGVMNGYVRDTAGRPETDVRVTVASPSETRTTYTGKNGFYVFLGLPPDTYYVYAEKSGTSDAYAPGARVNSDQTTSLDFFFAFSRCPAAARMTLSADKRSGQFQSLAVSVAAASAPTAAAAMFLPPIPYTSRYTCL